MPLMLKTVVLPLDGMIVYDGIMEFYNISFGGSIKRSLNNEYSEAKAKYGLVTSLPLKQAEEKSGVELLKFYMKTEDNFKKYRGDILDLVENSRENKAFYFQEIARKNTVAFKGKFKRLGVEPGWFAVLESIIIASGSSQDEVWKAVQKVLPGKDHDLVFVFKYTI